LFGPWREFVSVLARFVFRGGGKASGESEREKERDTQTTDFTLASMISSSNAGGESGYATLTTTQGVFVAKIRQCASSVSRFPAMKPPPWN
jgi:hypothetical protein